jgi:HAD superfamily hydrolase (TIGR01459 family)
MTQFQTLTGLNQVAERYDALLCDIWGVVHNGRAPFQLGCAALARYKAERGPVVLISNSPRPGRDVVAQLDGLGVPREAWSAVVTSGDATRFELRARAPGPAWALGPARDAALYEGTEVRFAETPEEAAFISCTGLFDDEVETPEDFRGRLQVCAERRLVMVCANPDRVVQRGDKMIFCAGALADLYESLGGQVVMAGKPSNAIYQLAYAEVDGKAGRLVSRERILAIGDGLPTDVLGANREGLDILFAAGTGIHGPDTLGADGRLDEAKTARLLAREGLSATYVMAELQW